MAEITEPCGCWCCEGQCAGTQDPGSCGPLEDIDGHLVCKACRETADVFGADFTGVKVTTSQEAVELAVDTFRRVTSAWLDADSADHLARLLQQHASALRHQLAVTGG